MEQQPGLRESIEDKKYEPSNETLCSFLNISLENLAMIRSRLENVEGHLRIWVHPLYTEQWPGTAQGRLGDADLTEVQEKLRSAFFRTTESVVRNPSSSPLVVYEAVKKIEETKTLIADNLGCGVAQLEELGIVFIPTEAGSSSLDTGYLIDALNDGNDSDVEEAEKITTFKQAQDNYFSMSRQHREAVHKAIPGLAEDPYYRMSDSEREQYLELRKQQRREFEAVIQEFRDVRESTSFDGSDFMVSLFKRLGVKSALVSGAYLEVGENYKTKELEFKACAGAVVKYLREAEFSTDISNNIWPPKELIKEAGFEVKQTSQASEAV
jgi:hypothetical protein